MGIREKSDARDRRRVKEVVIRWGRTTNLDGRTPRTHTHSALTHGYLEVKAITNEARITNDQRKLCE